MIVQVDMNLWDTLLQKETEKRKVLEDLCEGDPNIYRSIENDVEAAFCHYPSPEEVGEYVNDNFRELVSHYSSRYIPDKFILPENDEDNKDDM